MRDPEAAEPGDRDRRENNARLIAKAFDALTMAKYLVRLNGLNFQIEMDGEVRRVGFFTTRFVEASSAEAAEMKAVEMVRHDETLRAGVRNGRGDTPLIHLDEVAEVDHFPADYPNTGYSFYVEQSDDADA